MLPNSAFLFLVSSYSSFRLFHASHHTITVILQPHNVSYSAYLYADLLASSLLGFIFPSFGGCVSSFSSIISFGSEHV